MEIRFLKEFSKDLKKISDYSLLNRIMDIINKIESSENLNNIPNLKKMQGSNIAFRIRVGDYRVGIFFENDLIELARIVHRKDIYKVFP